ncbi:MAG: universal stress protein [Gemmatimonadales bacterium]|nr:universal stress protein [Gemmatimonadales bacterium]
MGRGVPSRCRRPRRRSPGCGARPAPGGASLRPDDRSADGVPAGLRRGALTSRAAGSSGLSRWNRGAARGRRCGRLERRGARQPRVDAIQDAARAPGTGMIALATHGRGGVRRLVLGSVADKLVRGGELPVLVTRPRSR